MEPHKTQCGNCSCKEYNKQKERYDGEFLDLYHERKATGESFICKERPKEDKICKKMYEMLVDYDLFFKEKQG